MKNDDVTHLMRAKHGLTQGLLITIASSLNVPLCDWLQDQIMTWDWLGDDSFLVASFILSGASLNDSRRPGPRQKQFPRNLKFAEDLFCNKQQQFASGGRK